MNKGGIIGVAIYFGMVYLFFMVASKGWKAGK